MTVRKQGRVLVLLLMAAIFLFMLGKSVSKWGEKKVELEKIIEMENGNLASLQYKPLKKSPCTKLIRLYSCYSQAPIYPLTVNFGH